MQYLTTDLFIAGVHDVESTQYRILNAIQKIRHQFRSNILYPHLGYLSDIYRTLSHVIENVGSLKKIQPHHITSLDLKNKRVVFEPETPLSSQQCDEVLQLIEWSLPKIEKTIAEGEAVFEFVEEHMNVGVVGIKPQYSQEGYLIIPDNAHKSVHYIRFELSIFTSSQENYRSLKTTVVESVPQSHIKKPLHAIKLELIKQFPFMPNPATYALQTDLDFPFASTIFPIAKRKLMKFLSVEPKLLPPKPL
jgi:hypothetical protein